MPYQLSDPQRNFHFMDDQGCNADLCLTDADEKIFKAVMKKLATA